MQRVDSDLASSLDPASILERLSLPLASKRDPASKRDQPLFEISLYTDIYGNNQYDIRLRK